MDDRELEAKLDQARQEADRFFSRRSVEPLRELVHRRVSAGFPRGSRRLMPFRRIGAGVAVGLVLIMAVLWKTPGQAPGGLGPPVAQQELALDGRGPAHWVNFFRVTQPDSIQQSLLAVMWAPQPTGGWQAVYSTLLQGEGDPLPVTTVKLPGGHHQLVLISSQDGDQKYLHYGLVGYNSGRVITYREQDYVPRGRIEIRQGVLVERRAKPGSYAVGGGFPAGRDREEQEVTNLIPYYVDENGKLVVPEVPLSLAVGQNVILVGNDGGARVRAFAQGGVSQTEQGFYASGLGDASLTLIPDDNLSERIRVPIKVVSPAEWN